MNSEKKTATILEDVKINVKIKLSALWVALMFLYVWTLDKANKLDCCRASKSNLKIE